jgi:hypothetical protein
MQFRVVECRHRKRPPGEQRPERAQLARPPEYGHRGSAPRIAEQIWNIIEIPSTVGETEDVYLVLCREMADFIEGGDLIAPVRRERDTLAYEEYSHQ